MMKKLSDTATVTAVALAVALPSVAAAADLTVAVTGLPQQTGSLVVCLWAQPDGFPDCSKGDSVVKSTTARDGATVRFNDLRDGTYAVSVLHDADGDGKLGTNFLGIPNEPIGFSNDAEVVLGPPKFAAAAFEIVGDETITVEVK